MRLLPEHARTCSCIPADVVGPVNRREMASDSDQQRPTDRTSDRAVAPSLT